MAKEIAPQQVSLTVPYRETISRLFIFRLLYVFIVGPVFYIWAIWMCIIMFLHFWYMLFTGSRYESFWKRQVRFTRYITRWQSYFNLLVDQRPGFIE